jgi:hypothetical protein
VDGAGPGSAHYRVGILGGLLLSMAAVKLLRGFLCGLSPFDPVVFAAAGMAWLIVAMLASWYPARHTSGSAHRAQVRVRAGNVG